MARAITTARSPTCAQGGRPVTTIGLCWEDQLGDSALPADPWDIKLDAIATPKEWVTCG